MSKTQDENALNDHTAGFGPYHRFLFSCPQQEGSWLCHPSSCQGSGSFSSPGICFSFSCLDPYRNPCLGRLFLGGGEDCETFLGHGSTCGEGTNAYRNARPTKEDSWPTVSPPVRILVCVIPSKAYLNTQTRAFEVPAMPVRKKQRGLSRIKLICEKDAHVEVGIFSMALTAKFHEGITTRCLRSC
jgi:hypothetical protein